MKLHDCSMEFLSSEVTLKKLDESHILPELELFIDTDLNFTIRVCVCGFYQIYKDYGRSVYFITVYKLLCQLNYYKICEGIVYPDVKPLSHLKKHITSKRFHFPIYPADMMDINFLKNFPNLHVKMSMSEVLVALFLFKKKIYYVRNVIWNK